MNDTLELFIKRFYSKPSHIIGQLNIVDKYFCDTLERPDLNNQENISCVPAGRYEVQMLNSPHFANARKLDICLLPHIINVPNRTNIMIHPVSTVNELEGCVGIGKNSAPGILTESREISDKLNATLIAELRPVRITISDVGA